MKFTLPLVDKLKTLYAEKLDDTQRKQVTVVAAGIVIVLVVGTMIALASSIGRMESRVRSKEKVLAELKTFSADYSELKNRQRKVDRMLATPEDSLTSFLEQEANSLGVTIDSMKPKDTPPLTSYKENRVSISLKKITLAELVDLFYKLENNRKLYKIGGVTVKPRFDNPSYLGVDFDVSSFELKTED